MIISIIYHDLRSNRLATISLNDTLRQSNVAIDDPPFMDDIFSPKARIYLEMEKKHG